MEKIKGTSKSFKSGLEKLGFEGDNSLYFIKWRYSIRIENLSKEPVSLRERHWRIFSQAGTFETVRGKGVVGQVRFFFK